MKIKSYKLGIAGAATIGFIYTVFALFLKMWPTQTLKFVGMVHMMPKLDYISAFIKVTPGAILLGIMTHIVLGFLFFFLISTVYNLLEK